MKVMRFALIVTVIAVLGLPAAAARSSRSKKIDYKSAGKMPPLEVPPDLTQPTRDDRYAVPDVATEGIRHLFGLRRRSRRSQATPATAQDVLPQVDKMRIERAGTQRWLVVAGDAGRSCGRWSRSSGRRSASSSTSRTPEAGVMETDWAENRAKIPQDVIRAIGQGHRRPVLDARARQVPHAPGAGQRAGHHGDLHQPSRHVRGLHQRRQERHALAAARRRIPISKPRCCAG